MNQPAVVRPDTPERTQLSMGMGLVAAAVVVVAVLAMALVARLSSGPSTVRPLTIENPTAYALDVEVRAAADSAWTSAGFVPQRSTAVVEEVVDQGAVWVFRFDSQGRSGGELQMTRSELEDAGWRVTVPADVGKRLAESGAPPTP